MTLERYTLGYDPSALAFVGRRTLESHGAFFVEHLTDGMQVLDVGCGPGSMTIGIAARVGTGRVTGVDLSASQVQLGKQRAVQQDVSNAQFQTGSAYDLPFQDSQYDAVFSHALLEHLSEPARAMNEFRRVLKPGGVMGVATPDWSGFLFGPATTASQTAVKAYEALQAGNGGDVNAGNKLSQYAVDAGFERVRSRARYENFEPVTIITDLLAAKLEEAGQLKHAEALRKWAHTPHAMFAEAWVACVGYRPD